MTLIPVEPIGHVSQRCFVESTGIGGSGLRILSMPDYPPSPRGKAFRAARLDRMLTLRDASNLMKMKAHELGGLESGRLTLSDAEWDELEERLKVI